VITRLLQRIDIPWETEFSVINNGVLNATAILLTTRQPTGPTRSRPIPVSPASLGRITVSRDKLTDLGLIEKAGKKLVHHCWGISSLSRLSVETHVTGLPGRPSSSRPTTDVFSPSNTIAPRAANKIRTFFDTPLQTEAKRLVGSPFLANGHLPSKLAGRGKAPIVHNRWLRRAINRALRVKLRLASQYTELVDTAARLSGSRRPARSGVPTVRFRSETSIPAFRARTRLPARLCLSLTQSTFAVSVQRV
jgi:hypothetical protein